MIELRVSWKLIKPSEGRKEGGEREVERGGWREKVERGREVERRREVEKGRWRE
jgi:hypothetical protein